MTHDIRGLAGMTPDEEGGRFIERPYSGAPGVDLELADLCDEIDHAQLAYERGKTTPRPPSFRFLADFQAQQAQAQSDQVAGYPHDDIAGVNAGDVVPRADNDNAYPDGNPKTAMGALKPDLSVVPPIALLHLATAMMNGAEKYGPFNWRDKAISYRPYLAAAMRHLASCLDGEDYSADTVEAGAPVHHLGHVMACCAIILDAESVGMMNDNRPAVPGVTGSAIETYRTEKRLAFK